MPKDKHPRRSGLKTLFCEPPGRTAILVSAEPGRNIRKTLRFRDAHAALDWCQANHVCLVYLPAPPLPEN